MKNLVVSIKLLFTLHITLLHIFKWGEMVIRFRQPISAFFNLFMSTNPRIRKIFEGPLIDKTIKTTNIEFYL